MATQIRKPRTRRTFPVTVSYQAPRPAAISTPTGRRTAIFAPGDVAVSGRREH